MVVPLKKNSNLWFFIDPFSYRVWIVFLITIPIYLITMWLANLIFYARSNLDKVTGFVLRNAFSETNSTFPNYEKVYQKLLILIWILCMFILVQSYAGNLTAMLAKPQLEILGFLKTILVQNSNVKMVMAPPKPTAKRIIRPIMSSNLITGTLSS